MTTTTTLMAMLYGQPKRMKTSMGLAAFPTGLWVGVPGAIKPVAENELGFTPTVYEHPIRTLPDLLGLLEMFAENDLGADYPAVCIDDISLICDTSITFWQDNPKFTASGKVDKFYPYAQLKYYLHRISEMSRHIGVSVLMIAHEQLPGSDGDGNFLPGGPALGSKKQVLRVPGWCDFNARAVLNSDYPDPWCKTGLFVDSWDANWVTGDRNGVGRRNSPPNLRELLRASRTEYRLQRVPGLEWQDGVADKLVKALDKGTELPKAVESVAASCSKYDQLHVRWALQDGIARAAIKRQTSASMFAAPVVKTTTKQSSTNPA